VNLATARELVYARLCFVTCRAFARVTGASRVSREESRDIGGDAAFSRLRLLLRIESSATNAQFSFAGEYILSSGIVEKDPLLNEASLALDDHPLVDLTNDSLGLNDTLGLEHAFGSELLGTSLLENTGVEGLLGNDTLGLPDEFNLEEALQLVGLDEAQPEVRGRVSRGRCVLRCVFRTRLELGREAKSLNDR